MGGVLESRCVGRVCGADGAVRLLLLSRVYNLTTNPLHVSANAAVTIIRLDTIYTCYMHGFLPSAHTPMDFV